MVDLFDVVSAFDQAGRHHQAGRLIEAAEIYGEILHYEPDHAEARRRLGVLEYQRGNKAGAIDHLRKSLEITPGNPRTLDNLGSVLLHSGEAQQAIDCFERALRLTPDDALLHYNLGLAHFYEGNANAAIASYREALQRDPDHFGSLRNLAAALQADGQLTAAIEAYRAALRRKPRHAETQISCAGAMLAKRQPLAAQAALDVALAQMPGHTLALSLKAVALAALGDRAGESYLVDFDRFCRPLTVSPPGEFTTLRDFNASLTDFILGHPSLEREPKAHATRNGWHTGELLADDCSASLGMRQVIEEAVESYRKSLLQADSHPFIASMPESYRLSGWAVVMHAQGHQVPHIHPKAWLSGVYYAAVPQAVSRGGQDQAGWIEFGRPREDLLQEPRPATRSYQPEEGKMILFPSYFWHRTIAFASEERRISLAFDVIVSNAA